MIIELTFKTPDVIEQALDDSWATADEKEKAEKICQKFVSYGEYATIIVDTEEETATVKPA